MGKALNVDGFNISLGGADGPTSIFVAGKIGAHMSIEIMIALIVVGIVICFLGLKLIKVLSALTGFAVGAAVGMIVTLLFSITGFTSAIIIFGCAVACMALLFVFNRIGIFFVALCMCSATASLIIKPESMKLLAMIFAVSFVVGIVAAIFAAPLTIVITAACGGIQAGIMIAFAAGLNGNAWIGYAIGGVLAVLGMIVQFVMHSKNKKMKKEELVPHLQGKASVESEVEKARMILEEDEDEYEETGEPEEAGEPEEDDEKKED